jgi:sodium-dependent phosphate cotransporter
MNRPALHISGETTRYILYVFCHLTTLICLPPQSEPEENPMDPKNVRTGKDRRRPTDSMHTGDTDFDIEDPAYEQEATWGEVCNTCFVHSPGEWLAISSGIALVCFFLYFFLFGLELLGSGAKVMGGCTAGELFGDEINPIAGLMIGILSTVLLQSLSTTTSIIVALVGAESVSVRQGIYMVMGANIGTSVTNTIVALGHLGDGDQLERAFAGATVHDIFNFLSVAILLPLEVITSYLYRLTKAIVKNAKGKDGEKGKVLLRRL